MSCCDCASIACIKGGELPKDCSQGLCPEDARGRLVELYANDEHVLMEAATLTAHEGTRDKWPRLREVIELARKTGVKRIGIASCATYVNEAPMLAEILRSEGFEVLGTMCKMATIRRSDVGMELAENGGDTILCNPVMQAEALNAAKTDMNIVVGLCVGHDMLFVKHSDALCTTLVVRDRSLGGPVPFREALENYGRA